MQFDEIPKRLLAGFVGALIGDGRPLISNDTIESEPWRELPQIVSLALECLAASQKLYWRKLYKSSMLAIISFEIARVKAAEQTMDINSEKQFLIKLQASGPLIQLLSTKRSSAF